MIKICCIIINFCVAALPVQPDHVAAPVLRPAVRVVRLSLHDHLHQTHELHHIQTHQHRLRSQEGDGLKIVTYSVLIRLSQVFRKKTNLMTAGETMNLIVIVGKIQEIQDTLGLTPSGLRAQEKLIKCPVRTVEIVQTGYYYVLISPVCQHKQTHEIFVCK